MKKLEDYWVIANVKGGRRKYNSKADAIASLDGKIPTYDHNLWINKVKALNRIKEYYDYKFFEKR